MLTGFFTDHANSCPFGRFNKQVPMSRFTLSKIFTPWMAGTEPPRKTGWYRTRTEPLTHSWWNGMAYFDGQTWWEFGMHATLSIGKEVKVLQWQGLAMPLVAAIETIRANMPSSAGARRRYERFLSELGATA